MLQPRNLAQRLLRLHLGRGKRRPGLDLGPLSGRLLGLALVQVRVRYLNEPPDSGRSGSGG